MGRDTDCVNLQRHFCIYLVVLLIKFLNGCKSKFSKILKLINFPFVLFYIFSYRRIVSFTKHLSYSDFVFIYGRQFDVRVLSSTKLMNETFRLQVVTRLYLNSQRRPFLPFSFVLLILSVGPYIHPLFLQLSQPGKFWLLFVTHCLDSNRMIIMTSIASEINQKTKYVIHKRMLSEQFTSNLTLRGPDLYDEVNGSVVVDLVKIFTQVIIGHLLYV